MRYIITLVLLSLSCLGFSQISTIKVAPILEPINYVPYDSTRNFLGEDVGQYIGQVLFLKGESESLRKYGYGDFIVDYINDDLSNYNNVYKGNKGECRYNSNYYDIAERYFRVLSVIKHPKANEQSYLYGTKYYLELEDRDSKERLYFRYDSKYESSFPFIVVGFYEKQKKNMIGQKFIFVNKALEGSYDIYTGMPITNVPKQIWTCKDFTIEEKYYSLALIIENSLGETTHIGYTSVMNDKYRRSGFTVQEADNYSKKFGMNNWDKILDRKVSVGFTEEMVRMSWGEPSGINRASYGDQWVYDGQYLYFEKGVLKSFN